MNIMNLQSERKYNKQHNIRSLFSVFLFYALFVSVVYIMPSLKYAAPYILAAPMMLATAIPFLQKRTPWTFHLLAMCAVFLTLTAISILTDSSPSAAFAVNNIFLRNIRFFLPIFWSCYAINYTTKKQQFIILAIFFTVIAFIFIKTLIALESDPWITRVLAQGKETSGEKINRYRMDNIGGFEYSYMIGIFSFCATWIAIKAKKIWIKIIAITADILIFYYIIETMYTTLLLLSFLGVITLLFLKIKSLPIRGILVITVIVSVFLSTPILKYLSGAFPEDSLLNTKFENFYYALTYGNIDKIGSRPDKIIFSIENWLKSPLFGIYDPNSNAHSLAFSTLETGGIIGFIPWFAMFFFGYNFLTKICDNTNREKQLIFISFAYVILLSILNPIGYVFEVTIAAFFIVPLCNNLV